MSALYTVDAIEGGGFAAKLSNGGHLSYHPGFLSAEFSSQLLSGYKTSLIWEQSQIKLFGKEIPIPRLNAWYADPGCDYGYTGTRLTLQHWTPELIMLKNLVESASHTTFNSVLVNWYRNGQDSMGWHSDDEAILGRDPSIASVSLGSARRFLLRHKGQGNRTNQMEIMLESGSLLLMHGSLQHHWKHSLPKTRACSAERINLTFRQINIPDSVSG